MMWENIKESLGNIMSNKMRSILTMLGIIIGITAVILITTIGSSIQTTLSATMNSLGGNALFVSLDANYPETDADWDTWEYPELDDEDKITDEMLDELVERYPDEIVGAMANNYLGSGKVSRNSDEYANVSVQGITTTYMDYMNLNMIYGRNISKEDCNGQKSVCVISDRMAKNYFGEENPIGKQIIVETETVMYQFVVVGIYEYNVAIFGKEDTSIPEKDRETAMFIPYQTASKLLNSNTDGMADEGYQYFQLILKNTADGKTATEHVKEFFNEKYADNPDWQVNVMNMQSEMKIINVVINVVTIAISLIAAISLIVGGVGVMNIMLVSITERTKEIGIRKALGAKNSIIRFQFIIEAIVLCLIGGIIGIILGITGGLIIGLVADIVVKNFFADYAKYIIITVRPSIPAMLISVFFSMLTGVFFGFYPANKAAKMEVIDALRYE